MRHGDISMQPAPDPALQRRRVRFAALVRDVLATLPDGPGLAWLREHRALAKRSIAGLEREWAATKGGMRR